MDSKTLSLALHKKALMNSSVEWHSTASVTTKDLDSIGGEQWLITVQHHRGAPATP
jgi:hypothetical protein